MRIWLVVFAIAAGATCGTPSTKPAESQQSGSASHTSIVAAADPSAEATVDAAIACSAERAEAATMSRSYASAHRQATDGLTFVEAEILPTDLVVHMGGAAPSQEEIDAEDRAFRTFHGKKTGDRVTYEAYERPIRSERRRKRLSGVWVDETTHPGWALARRGNQLFVVIPRSIRTIECVDVASAVSPQRCGRPSRGLVFAIPPDMKYAGIITVEAVMVRLDVHNGREVGCPP